MAKRKMVDTDPRRAESVAAWKDCKALYDIRAIIEPVPGKLMQDELVEAVRRIVAERDAGAKALERTHEHNERRYARLRRWVTEEVAPMSKEAETHYYNIIANGKATTFEI